MKIWHRRTFEPDAESMLQELGLQYKHSYGIKDPNKVSFIALTIDEANPAWSLLSELGSETQVYTEFTLEEILLAEWLIARPTHSIGYSLPSGTSWSKEYYERGCKGCWANWKQIAPFRVSPKTKMGKYAFASFWGGFELFCSTDVLAMFEEEKIRGYDTWPLLLTKAQEPLAGIKQLRFDVVATPAVVDEIVDAKYFRKHQCPTENHIWYDYHRRGMLSLRREALHTDVDFQLTHEWFGNGRTVRREILVSKRVAELVIKQKWKGLNLSPVQLV
jgi:hypothetical protein